jgi:hypothetical protein
VGAVWGLAASGSTDDTKKIPKSRIAARFIAKSQAFRRRPHSILRLEEQSDAEPRPDFFLHKSEIPDTLI